MTNRALRSFMTLPPVVRMLWLLAAFMALNVMLRVVA